MRKYVFRSFEQIDVELEILSVERELSRVRMDQAIRSTKISSLGGHALNLATPILRNMVMSWMMRKVKERLKRSR